MTWAPNTNQNISLKSVLSQTNELLLLWIRCIQGCLQKYIQFSRRYDFLCYIIHKVIVKCFIHRIIAFSSYLRSITAAVYLNKLQLIFAAEKLPLMKSFINHVGSPNDEHQIFPQTIVGINWTVLGKLFQITTFLTLKSYCSEIQHRYIPAGHIRHTILS